MKLFRYRRKRSKQVEMLKELVENKLGLMMFTVEEIERATKSMCSCAEHLAEITLLDGYQSYFTCYEVNQWVFTAADLALYRK